MARANAGCLGNHQWTSLNVTAGHMAAGLALGAWLGLCGAGAVSTAHADVAVPVETFRGQQGPRIGRIHSAHTNEEWVALWSLVNQRPPRELVEGSETGVAVFLGERPTGGYRIEITNITHTPENLKLAVDVSPPKAVATQGLTAPYMFMIIKAKAERTHLTLQTDLTPPPPPEDHGAVTMPTRGSTPTPVRFRSPD